MENNSPEQERPLLLHVDQGRSLKDTSMQVAGHLSDFKKNPGLINSSNLSETSYTVD